VATATAATSCEEFAQAIEEPKRLKDCGVDADTHRRIPALDALERGTAGKGALSDNARGQPAAPGWIRGTSWGCGQRPKDLQPLICEQHGCSELDCCMPLCGPLFTCGRSRLHIAIFRRMTPAPRSGTSRIVSVITRTGSSRFIRNPSGLAGAAELRIRPRFSAAQRPCPTLCHPNHRARPSLDLRKRASGVSSRPGPSAGLFCD
jgi:hypothetical protein